MRAKSAIIELLDMESEQSNAVLGGKLGEWLFIVLAAERSATKYREFDGASGTDARIPANFGNRRLSTALRNRNGYGCQNPCRPGFAVPQW